MGLLYRDLEIEVDRRGRFFAAALLIFGGLVALTLAVSWWFVIPLGLLAVAAVGAMIVSLAGRARPRNPTRTPTSTHPAHL
ncbi:hypothetical protein DDQ50_13685 [Amnibacterium flavum]|uniref:Uncharacterized protein n=1 Tax=Amnibacterium flavum TaxID=2173173 RepID=A0A2V1HW97_9MICO|nr:hypothetical protein DDQ50_13685 [Amnibacterium flavum]